MAWYENNTLIVKWRLKKNNRNNKKLKQNKTIWISAIWICCSKGIIGACRLAEVAGIIISVPFDHRPAFRPHLKMRYILMKFWEPEFHTMYKEYWENIPLDRHDFVRENCIHELNKYIIDVHSLHWCIWQSQSHITRNGELNQWQIDCCWTPCSD